MLFQRLIKPDWAKPTKANGDPNPDFKEEIQGDDVVDGCNLDPSYVDQMNSLGYNIYFFPNHPSTDVYSEKVKFLSGKLIDTFNYVFIDMDLKDKVYSSKSDFIETLKSFPITPTMTVDSGNGIHAYWKIKSLSRDEYVFTQLSLISLFKTDQSVFTTLQLMRQPGTMNTKRYKDYVPSVLIPEVSSDQEYDLSEFPPEIFEIPPEVVKRGQNHLDKLDGKMIIALPEGVNLEEIPDSFIEFVDDPKNVATRELFVNPQQVMGDRSRADLRLANILLRAEFSRKDALAIMSNSQKALSKGAHRFSYAQATIDKVYSEKLTSKFRSVGEKLRMGDNDRNLGALLRSSEEFDYGVLGNPWRKRELTGLIAGTGVGKTTVTLRWVRDTIKNNPDNDDVHVFVSLEMSEGEITDKWLKLTKNDSKLADRLYVIANEEDDGTPRNLGLQEIHEYCIELKKLTGKNIGLVAIDHLGIVSKRIDTRKKYTFGIDGELGAGFGPIKTISLPSLATQMKSLAKMIDAHLVILTQTTKGKGVGDLPIDKDGAFGISQYENIMDRIITVWQPLQRVQHLTKLMFTAWQYVKIRNKDPKDKISAYEAQLMTFDLNTGDLKASSQSEYDEFQKLYPEVQKLRENQEKKKGVTNYSITVNNQALQSKLNAMREANNAVGKIQSH